MIRRCLRDLALFLASMLIGCAALPPAQPANNLNSIVGKWEGFVTDVRGQPLFAATLTINRDGTFEHSVPALKGTPFVGSVSVVDGKFLWKATSTGRTGSYTLHEGDGKRVLTSVGEGTDATGEYKPAK